MPRFRKRPVTIEANQWFPGQELAGVLQDANGYFVVTIHEQSVYLAPGDWILPEPDGIHYYPVKPDVFEATYIPAIEETRAQRIARWADENFDEEYR